MRIFFLCIVFLLASCQASKVHSENLAKKYFQIDNVCDKISFFQEELNTKQKQFKKHQDFMKIVADLEKVTGINSNTIKGIGGVSYGSNKDIKEDIKKWKLKCK